MVQNKGMIYIHSFFREVKCNPRKQNVFQNRKRTHKGGTKGEGKDKESQGEGEEEEEETRTGEVDGKEEAGTRDETEAREREEEEETRRNETKGEGEGQDENEAQDEEMSNSTRFPLSVQIALCYSITLYFSKLLGQLILARGSKEAY